jgi:predicted metalloprotease with PDZ domain
LFERTEWLGPPGQQVLTPMDNFRLYGLQRSVKAGHVIPFANLITETQAQFLRGNALLAYAESGSIMHYLYDKGELRKFYDAYAKDFPKDATGKMALEEVSGLKLDDLQKDWKQWMLARVPPTMYTGPNGPYMGIMLSQATDGIGITTIAPDSPAAKAGLQINDEIVALNGIDVRDMLSFMPMLSEHKIGEAITLHIHRGDKYFDVDVTLARRPPSQAASTPRPGTVPSTKPSRVSATQP